MGEQRKGDFTLGDLPPPPLPSPRVDIPGGAPFSIIIGDFSLSAPFPLDDVLHNKVQSGYPSLPLPPPGGYDCGHCVITWSHWSTHARRSASDRAFAPPRR